MEEDLRYKMQHIGDIFIDKVQNFGSYAKGSVRGIALTYNIDEYKKDKDKIVKRIGERLAAIRKKDSDRDVFNDKIMVKLFYRLDTIQDKIDAGIKERNEKLYPNKARS